jgi:hypothetical protein
VTETAATDIRCLQCGSWRVRRSRRRNWSEHVFSLFGTIRRCHDCNIRVLQWKDRLFRMSRLARVTNWLAFTILIVCAAAVLLAVVVWLGRGEAGSQAVS